MMSRHTVGLTIVLIGALLLSAMFLSSCAPPSYRGIPEDQLWRVLQ